jgi:hypothetical protein
MDGREFARRTTMNRFHTTSFSLPRQGLAEAIEIELHGTGPAGTSWVNAADEARRP